MMSTPNERESPDAPTTPSESGPSTPSTASRPPVDGRSASRRFLDRPASLKVVFGVALLALAPQALALLAHAPPLTESAFADDTLHRLGVQNMVRSVKRELEALEDSTCLNNEAPLFEGRDFQLEISFTAHADAGAKGGFHYDVLTAEAERHVGSERVQKLLLKYAFVGERRDSVAPMTQRPVGDAMPLATVESPCSRKTGTPR